MIWIPVAKSLTKFLIYVFVGLPSPSGREQKHDDAASFQRSQTFGQRIMGNVMDNLLVRTLTMKSKGRPEEVQLPSPPVKKVQFNQFLTQL